MAAIEVRLSRAERGCRHWSLGLLFRRGKGQAKGIVPRDRTDCGILPESSPGGVDSYRAGTGGTDGAEGDALSCVVGIFDCGSGKSALSGKAQKAAVKMITGRLGLKAGC